MRRPYGVVLNKPRFWTPRSLTGLKAWYQFGVGIHEDDTAGKVSKWDDQSGNGYHLTAAGAYQPDVSGGIITFDGSHRLDMASSTFTQAQPLIIYLLVKPISWAFFDKYWDNGSGTANFFSCQQHGTTPAITIYGGSNYVCSNTDLTIGNWHAFGALYDGVSSLIQVGSGGTPTTTVTTAGTGSLEGITLGSSKDSSNLVNASVKEMIVYGASHDASTRASILSYLESL